MVLNPNEVVGSIKGKNGAGKEFSFNLTLADVKHIRRILQFYSTHPTLLNHINNNSLLVRFKLFGVRHGRNKEQNKSIIKKYNKCSVDRCFNNNLTADHIVPLSCGGSNEQSNLRVLCRKHHDIVEHERSINRLTKNIEKLKIEVLNGS